MSTSHQLFFLFTLSGVILTRTDSQSSNVKISRCAIGTETVQNYNSVSQHKFDGHNCFSSQPYCGYTFQYSSSGSGQIVINRTCMSEEVCIQRWWKDSSLNPQCHENSLNDLPGHDFQCTYCCHEANHSAVSLYCNGFKFPQSLWNFTDINRPPQETTTLFPKTSTQIIQNTTSILISTLFSQSSQTSDNLNTTTNLSSQKIDTTSSQPKLSTTAISENLSTVSNKPTTVHHLRLGNITTPATQCVSWNSVTDGFQERKDAINCTPGEENYCMTSFYRNDIITGGWQIEKQCATRQQCLDNWWNGLTRTDSSCMDRHLRTVRGHPALECHYCCTQNPNDTLCNAAGSQVVPKNLLDMDALATLPVTPSTTTSTISETSNPQPIQSETSNFKSTMGLVQASSIKPPVSETPSLKSTMSLVQGSSTEASMLETSDFKSTMGLVQDSSLNPTSNVNIQQNATSIKTRPTVQTRAPSQGKLQCVQCGDYGAGTPCSDMELLLDEVSECNSPASLFCMTDVIIDSNRNKNIFKRCVDASTCVDDWYLATSDTPLCLEVGDSSVQSELTCHFCCVGDNCNVNILPEPNKLWRP